VIFTQRWPSRRNPMQNGSRIEQNHVDTTNVALASSGFTSSGTAGSLVVGSV
jgi:hypothetical protein